MPTLAKPNELADFIATLNGDHSELDNRMQQFTHSVSSKQPRVRVRAHYLKFRDGNATVGEFIDIISRKIVSFALSRRSIAEARAGWSKLTPEKLQESANELYQRSIDLFKKASKKSNRNGEFGELVTYLLIEHVLKAPQIVAKMNLKTNSQMPVHGSDGIHMRYDASTDTLTLLWGEAKAYQSVETAIAKAVESVAENLQHKKMHHELFLVRDYLDWPDLPAPFKEAVLNFLDPYSPSYNQRADTSVIFIVFDFDGFAKLIGIDPANTHKEFELALDAALPSYAARIDKALAKEGISGHSIEVFFMPIPSVDTARALFQDKIGWTA